MSIIDTNPKTESEVTGKAAPTKYDPRALVIFSAMRKAVSKAESYWFTLAEQLNGLTEQEAKKVGADLRKLSEKNNVNAGSLSVYLSDAIRFIRAGKTIPETRAEALKTKGDLPKSPNASKGRPKKGGEAAEGSATVGAQFIGVCESLELQPAEAAEVLKTVAGLSGRALTALAAAIHRCGEEDVCAVLTAMTPGSFTIVDEEPSEAELEAAELAELQAAANG